LLVAVSFVEKSDPASIEESLSLLGVVAGGAVSATGLSAIDDFSAPFLNNFDRSESIASLLIVAELSSVELAAGLGAGFGLGLVIGPVEAFTAGAVVVLVAGLEVGSVEVFTTGVIAAPVVAGFE